MSELLISQFMMSWFMNEQDIQNSVSEFIKWITGLISDSMNEQSMNETLKQLVNESKNDWIHLNESQDEISGSIDEYILNETLKQLLNVSKNEWIRPNESQDGIGGSMDEYILNETLKQLLNERTKWMNSSKWITGWN